MANFIRVNVSLNEKLYNKYRELNEQFYKLFGSRMILSPIVNDVVKVQVQLMEDMLENYKEGKLTPEAMLEYYYKRVTEETKEVEREAGKTKLKRG